MAKKQHKPKKPSQAWKLYEAKGELKRLRQSCPKCGPGKALAQHSNRASCGKCGYTEMGKR